MKEIKGEVCWLSIDVNDEGRKRLTIMSWNKELLDSITEVLQDENGCELSRKLIKIKEHPSFIIEDTLKLESTPYKTEKGGIVIVPIKRHTKLGEVIDYEARGYKKGMIGVFEVNKDFVKSIDMPLEQVCEVNSIARSLSNKANSKLLENKAKIQAEIKKLQAEIEEKKKIIKEE